MKDHTPALPISGFSYTLPDERIAMFPVHPKHNSRLLVYQNHQISHRHFHELPEILNENVFVVFNDTRVIPARLIFPMDTGRAIEVFLHTPLNPQWTEWECQVGNRRKFREGQILSATAGDGENEIKLSVEWLNRDENKVRLSSDTSLSIAEVLDIFGKIPLPPYIKREGIPDDKEDYQTIFARNRGAVAAPTASLHFTEEVIDKIKNKGIPFDYITLHVGLGTFKPVTAATAHEHAMHAETFEVSAAFISTLMANLHKQITAAGTTSMRVLESLYYVGAQKLLGKQHPEIVPKDAGFNMELQDLDTKQALQAAMHLAEQNGGRLIGKTSIFILPGFKFRICGGLITNFHQPGSTLLLLVAAFIGPEWKEIYADALANGYRFLSYGDASLLVPQG